MSMLAGPRRKQKWTLNPRGKQWSEDSSKFGQKMLEKMGWSHGKGLGAQEQGVVEHIRVKMKNDQVGFGYNKGRDDQWSEYQDEFDNFLQNLQKEQSLNNVKVIEGDDKILSGKSLEEKSKKSQKRVHYRKFIRGKDVNKYSTKDLANIFGKRDLNEKYAKEKEKNEENENEVYDPVGTKDTTAGILTIKGGNVNDYFKKKPLCFSERNNISQNKDSFDTATEKYAGFGYSVKSKSKFYVNDDGTSPVNKDSDNESERYAGLSKSKKLNNLNYVFDNPCLDLNILDDNSPISKKMKNEDLKFYNILTPKKRKNEHTYENEEESLELENKPKLKKHKGEFSYENKALNLEFPDKLTTSNKEEKFKNKIENSILNENETIPDLNFLNRITPKKSKENKGGSLASGYENYAYDEENSKKITLKTPKESENKPLSDGYENYAFDEEYSAKITLKTPKESENKPLSDGYDNFGLELELLDNSTQKNSKKMKIKPLSDGNENHILDIELPESLTPKRIKKDASNALSNGYHKLGFNLEVSDKSTQKKTKRNGEVLSTGYENLGLDLNSPDTSLSNKNKTDAEFDDLLNAHKNLQVDVPSKVLLKKRKKEKDSEILSNKNENSTLDLERLNRLTPTKPKRCKKNKVLSTGIENPALDLESLETRTPIKNKKNKETEIPLNVYDNPNLDLNDSLNEVSNIAKFEISRTSCGMENSALDLSDENLNKKRVTFNDQVEYSSDIVKNKKIKKKLDKYEVVNDKFKKLNKIIEPVAFVNEGLDIDVINKEEIDNELNERKSKKSKRRKERRISLLETIEETPEEENLNQSTIIMEETVKTDNREIAIANDFIHKNKIEDIQESVNETLSKKKYKKKKNTTTENSTLTDKLEEINLTEENIEVIDIYEKPNKIHKKKKKKYSIKEPIEVTEIDNEIDNREKENVCSDKDEITKEKRTEIPLNEDKVSLEEFLSEDVQETKSNFEKVDEICTTNNDETELDDNLHRARFNSFYKSKKSKEMIKALFLKNPILLFNGSNINEIKGYGYD